MRLKQVAGAIVMGGLMLGCQSSTKPEAASTLRATDESTIASLQKSYRASHPGSEVGVVNAVDPARRILSVADIPPERVRPGSFMSILIPGGGSVQAVVYAKASGYVQLRYEALPPGQTGPSAGNLAIWIPGGPAVIQDAIPPSVEPPIASPAPGVAAPPIAAPGVAAPPIAAPTEPAMPTSRPMVDLEPASRPALERVPATQPAVEPPTTLTTTPIAPPPVVPQSRPVPDINK